MSRETVHDCSSPNVFTLMCQNEVLMSMSPTKMKKSNPLILCETGW